MGTELTKVNVTTTVSVIDDKTIPTRKLLDRYKEINEEDRKQMFGFSTESDLRSFMRKENVTCDDVMKLLDWFKNEYQIPFWTGDVIKKEDDGSKWIVTCVYTDGSIDLISAEGKVVRKNTGTLKNDYIPDGQLEKIMEPEIRLADLLKM